MKKKFEILVALVLCLSMIFVQSVFAASVDGTEPESVPAEAESVVDEAEPVVDETEPVVDEAEPELTKEEYYEIFLALLEEHNANYQIITVVPASFEDFGLLSMEEIYEFLEFCDEIDAWQAETAPEFEAEWLQALSEPCQEEIAGYSIQTVKHEAITTGAADVTMIVTLSAGTTLNSAKTKQIFDASTCSFGIKTSRNNYGTWTTTANLSGVNSSNAQQYNVRVVGRLTITAGGYMDGLGISSTFYCSDIGVIS